MRTLTLEIPEDVTLSDRELQWLLLAKLYERGEVSMGRAALILGIRKEEFMTRLGDFGVSAWNFTEEELNRDFENASRYSRHQLPDSAA